VLVIGGARATPGAALLAGTSALRAGAGKLTLAVAGSVAVQLGVALPECGSIGLPETADGSVKPDLSRISSSLDRADTLLVGPGLDDLDLAAELLQALLGREGRGPHGTADAGSRPGADAEARGGPVVVLDAFALAALVPFEDHLDPWRGRLILTPNPTEAGILLGRDVDDLEKDLAEVSARFGAVVSCQGLITRPPGLDDGLGLWKITTGYGGLGTSGSGDVLAGAIAGLRARGTTSAQAACWGTHLHAAAADRLASRLGPLGFLARELADEMPALMLELST
jgi:hydroxyethylthiazole kinase-like uncharacterized protein yjeF